MDFKHKKVRKHLFIAVCGLGGDGRDRTVDLLNAIQALSQLSYAPVQYIVYLMNYTKEVLSCQQLFAIFQLLIRN